MATVSPHYQQKGVANPYYVMDQSTIVATKNALKTKGVTVAAKDILFKAVDRVKGQTIVANSGKFLFQLALNKQSQLNYGIKITKKQVKGHLGMKTRKDSTASSNVNEFLTVYYLLHKQGTPKDLEDLSCKEKKKSTGVLTGEGTPVTYEMLCEMIDRDESAERDIKIGMNNAKAVKKDIKGEKIKNLYWVPRGKPQGISPKTPSDVIIEFKDGTFQGYSNKISAGKDDTPKFNTNIYAFYGKLENTKQQTALGNIINTAWNDAAADVKGATAKGVIQSFDITQEAFSESKSRNAFASLSSSFKIDNLDFYADGFYYPFRNNLIKGFSEYLEKPTNMVYFLNTIYFYTYDDPRSAFTPCPYKLLIGRESGQSTIKDVSDNEELKELLVNKDSKRIKNIKTVYDGKSQSFKIGFTFANGNNKKVEIPITVRTRAAGGWSGKSLFITTSGVKFV
tara:strand:+ start:56 stop:1411 length:1356 start_codon:yes stop_codon:yes gene_type:complete